MTGSKVRPGTHQGVYSMGVGYGGGGGSGLFVIWVFK